MEDWNRSTLLTFLAALLGGVYLASVPANADEFFLHRWRVIADGNQLGLVTLEPCGPHRMCLKFARVEQTGDGLVLQEGRVIANLLSLTGFVRNVDASRLPSGTWVMVSDEAGGGTSIVQIIELEQSLFDSEVKATPTSHLVYAVRVLEPVTKKRTELIDLIGPRLVGHRGRMHIVCVGRNRDRPVGVAPKLIWIAAVDDVADRKVAGTVVGVGDNPRVTKWEDRVVVAGRVREPNTDWLWGRQLRLYESTDLKNWRAMPAPDPTLEFFDYDLAVGQAGLTLTGLVDASVRDQRRHRGSRNPYTPPLAMVTLVFDSQNGKWREISRNVDAAYTTKTEIGFLPGDGPGGRLRLIERANNNRFSVRDLNE